MKITVKVFEHGREISSKIFDEGVYRIGRSDFSDVVLDHEAVSRSHVELRVTEAGAYMTNMSGVGRVKINGKAKETSELADGDELSLGPYRVVIYHGERAPEAAPMGGALVPADAAASGMAEGLQPEPGANPFADGGEGQPAGSVIGEGGGEAGGFGAGALAEGFMADGGEGGVAVAEPAPAMEDQVGGTAHMVRQETEVEIKPLVAKLVFVEGPRVGEEIPIETYEVTLGRSKRADIYLDDEKLSRVHAKITRVGMGYRLIDMNSRNGTYVNGVRVLEHPLASFDQIELGKSKIKFLIIDLIAGDIQRAPLPALANEGSIPPREVPQFEQTKSIMVDAIPHDVLNEMRQPASGYAPPPAYPMDYGVSTDLPPEPNPFLAMADRRKKLIFAAIIALGVIYLLLPGEKQKAKEDPRPITSSQTESKIPALMPKEYVELSPELQRMVEGHYNSAQKAAELGQYEEAVSHLRKIHDYLPYYKQSRELLDAFSKKLKEKQIAEAQQRAKQDERQDLQIYLDEGLDYLREGDFERAADSFNSAIVIDPTNPIAVKGLKAAEAKVRSLEEIPPERDPEQDKRKLVAELFQKAVGAFTNKSYQEAIDTADQIRRIELKGDTQYLNEAKQIIDRARMLQKEEFEPFLIQAKEKYAEGDFNASRDLCEEMLKRDGAYDEAKECVFKAKKQLNRLAKEAYVHGYILESMNRLEEAKQYWNRAKNYVRQGDEYFDKINKKLDYYQ